MSINLTHNSLSKNINDKVGNIIVYLATLLNPLYLTKAIKLLYYIDEESVKETGVPITGLKHEAWENGPVSREVFVELHCLAEDCKYMSLDPYIKVEKITSEEEDSYKISAKSNFDNSEFSKYEMGIIDRVIRNYGNKHAKELIDIVHKEGTPWSVVVKNNNLKEKYFKVGKKSSDFPVDLYPLIGEDEIKKIAYVSAEEANWFDKQLCK